MPASRPARFAPCVAVLLILAACAPDGSAPVSGDAGGALPLGPADGRDLPAMDLDRLRVGDLAPDFTLAAFSGDPVTLSDFRGETNVILVFYRGHW